MRRSFLIFLYNLLFPIFFLVGLPGWVIKMRKRGGFGTGLLERLGRFKSTESSEQKKAVYVHAVSVGETLLALKMIQQWRLLDPDQSFILAPTTATGHEVARKYRCAEIRVIYSPVDFGFIVAGVLKRFAPKLVVLIESEIWPNLLNQCRKKDIPVMLVNARLSRRSEERFRRFIWLLKPVFAMLKGVCIQSAADGPRWEALGVKSSALHRTGSIKFDLNTESLPQKRAEFDELLKRFSGGKKVVVLVSTFAGEEKAIAKELWSLRERIFLLVVPRHSERRSEVVADLKEEGYVPVLRSVADVSARPNSCLIVDTTGELRDWIAHANLAIIGKSWMASGGQNPAEAIAAGVPVIVGPRMDNFEPLVSKLAAESGLIRLPQLRGLAGKVVEFLDEVQDSRAQVARALAALREHEGATRRTIDHLTKSLQR